MKVKKINRYYCDYCKKANCSSASISKHEKSCTLNPNRICRMCAMFDLPQTSMNELLAILPKPEILEDDIGLLSYVNIGDVEKSMVELRSVSNNCPACIMAAIRQKGFPVPAIHSFSFTEECKEWWADFNDARIGE